MLIDIGRLRRRLKIWGSDLEKVPVIGKLIRKSKTFSLPGFQHIPIYNVMDFFFQSMGKGIVFQRSAALTYRIFAALIPMVIAFFSVISFLGAGVHESIISMLQSLIPTYAWPAVEDVITGVVIQQNGTLSALMFVLGIYFTILCCNGLLAATNVSYLNDERRSFPKQLLLSAAIMIIVFFVMLTVAGVFIVSSVILNDIHNSVQASEKLYTSIVHVVKWVITYAALYFLISILYYLSPVHKKHYRFFSAGSSTATILMVILLWVLNLFFRNFSNYNLIYGSLGALFGVLLWINWSSLIFLIGFELNISIAKAKEKAIENGSNEAEEIIKIIQQ